MHKTKNDRKLKEDVEAELRACPHLNDVTIGVAVERGAVSLLGSVDSFAQRWAAEDAVRRVDGVRAFAQNLTVAARTDRVRTDSDIAAALASALEIAADVPNDVSAKVHRGVVTLMGCVALAHERGAAVDAVRGVAGVTAVNDFIHLAPGASAEVVRQRIEAALQQQTHTDATSIHVEAVGGTVTLTGHAASRQSIDGAAHAAWAAPGVVEVVNHVHVLPTR